MMKVLTPQSADLAIFDFGILIDKVNEDGGGDKGARRRSDTRPAAETLVDFSTQERTYDPSRYARI